MPVITNSLSGTSAKLLDNTNVTLRFDSSSFTNQVVTLADKTYTNKITITRPFELIASNIKKGVEIAGITGTYEVVLNTETAETPLQMKDGNQVILPSKPNYTLSEVTIVKPNTFTPENIKAGVEIGGITGTYTGSSENTLKNLLDATKSCYYLFCNYKGTSIDDLITYNDTSNVIDMRYMFYNCYSFTTIPQLDTSNVTNMSYMFADCHKLSSVPLLNTSNVTDMSYMFISCYSLTTIPQLDTSNVTNIINMFNGCSKLTTIPLLNTSKVTSLNSMFYNCISLPTIPLLDTSKVTSLYAMFYNCKALTTIPALDTSKVTNLNYMFYGCSSLKSILMTGMKVSFDISASTQFEESDLVTILNNLATVTTTQTLTMGATNLAKLTDEEKKIATDKGWTLA